MVHKTIPLSIAINFDVVFVRCTHGVKTCNKKGFKRVSVIEGKEYTDNEMTYAAQIRRLE